MGDDLYVNFGSQVRVIVYSFIFGLFLSAVYDGLRLLRTFLGCGVRFKPGDGRIALPLIGQLGAVGSKVRKRSLLKAANDITVFIFDIVYAVFAVVATLLFLYTANDGIVRSYSVLAIAAAFVLYMKTAAVLTGKTAGAIIFAFRVIFAYVLFFTVKPVAFIIRKAAAAAVLVYSVTAGRFILKWLTARENKKQKEYFAGFGEEINTSIKSALDTGGA